MSPSAPTSIRSPSERRALAAPGDELLVGAEVVDVAELDVGHRVAAGDGDAEAVRGQRAAGVERAVDRVDHDPGGAAVAELDLAALLGDGDERGALLGQRVELGEDDVLAAAVDDQGAIAALADALVDGAGLDAAHLIEDRRCAATARRQIPSQSAEKTSMRLILWRPRTR